MIYQPDTGDLQGNWATGLEDGTNRTEALDVKCATGTVLQAIPAEPQATWFTGITVEARPITDPESDWQDIVAEPYDLAPLAQPALVPFQFRFSAEADLDGRKMVALYVGPEITE